MLLLLMMGAMMAMMAVRRLNTFGQFSHFFYVCLSLYEEIIQSFPFAINPINVYSTLGRVVFANGKIKLENKNKTKVFFKLSVLCVVVLRYHLKTNW